MNNTLIMHVNYCEQGQSIEEMCRKAVGWGFDGIEFRRQRSKVAETPEQYLNVIAAAVKKSGLRQVLFGGPGVDLMTADAAQRDKNISVAIDFYRLAAERFKLTVCNTMTGQLISKDIPYDYNNYAAHGSALAAPEQWARAAAGFKELGKLAESLGFKFAFETHMGYLHDYPLVAGDLVDRIASPAVGVNLDYGNAFLMANNPPLADTIRKLVPRIFYVHLKNYMPLPAGGWIATGLADGAINHREYLRLLREAGFTGPVCIEAPRPGDREWFAREDADYIRQLMREIDAEE